MNFDTLEKTWRKQIVTGADQPVGTVVARLKREVASAQRRIRGGIVLVTLVLFIGWAVTIVAHVTGIKRLTSVGLGSEAVYFVLAVAFLVRAFRSARAVRNEMTMLGGTLQESLGATLRTVELQIENARIAGYAIPIVVAISVWLFTAKYLAGDFPAFGVVIGGSFTALIGAMIGTIIWHRYRTQLAPRCEELKETLRALGQNDWV